MGLSILDWPRDQLGLGAILSTWARGDWLGAWPKMVLGAGLQVPRGLALIEVHLPQTLAS